MTASSGDAVSRALESATRAVAAADTVAHEYGKAPLDVRPRLLALTQFADVAALHARVAAARVTDLALAADAPGSFDTSTAQLVEDLVADALRYARDAETALTAATY